MPKQIAFLRGINVGGQRKVPMAELRTLLTNNRFKGVSTYIQSGNIIFDEADASVPEIKVTLEEIIKAHFGFEVPVLVKSLHDLQKIIRNNPFSKKEDLEFNRVYFVMFFGPPEKEKLASFKDEIYPNESWELLGDCLYLCCSNGYGNAKLNNNLVERKLGVEATTRNYRTMLKILEIGNTN